MARSNGQARAFREHAAQLRQHRVRLETFLLDIFRAILFKLYEGLVIGNEFGNPTGTPVKTGFARASWYLDRAGTMPPSETVDPTGAATLAAGGEKILAAMYGDPFFFTNGAEYFIYLEYGSSQGQAPQGIVRILIANAQALVDSVVQEMAA